MFSLPMSRPRSALRRTGALRLLGLSLAGTMLVAPGGASAQREIVQPLPRPEAGALNAALLRLSTNPNDLTALVQAGDASLALNDAEAAQGFYSRALAAAPGAGFAKFGLARVRLASRDPLNALTLFDEAERAGVPASQMAADRAFAYDLVGDPARAQALYREALAQRDQPDVRRKLALSLAITGQRQAFEDTIFPLLSANDRAAFRTRAFGLAILGEEEEAVVIAETMLPTDLALRMAPYLRYMPRLTRAQQAAAANLGVFPRAADIGRDDAAIAAYGAQGQRIARSADASLTPSGQPMGQARSASPINRQRPREERRRRPDRETPPALAQAPAPVQQVAAATAIARPVVQPATPPVTPPVVRPPVAQPALARADAATVTPSPVVQPNPSAQPVLVLPTSVTEAAPAPAMAVATPPPPAPAPAQSAEPVASVADVFADMGAVRPTATPGIAAVDITAIRPPREVAQVAPAPVVHPARHWVQVATGRDRAALKFDWRRIARGAKGALDGKGPFVTPWVEANRLLAGPYPTAAAAREKVNELKALEIDAFPFSSEAGQEIVALD